MKNKTFPACCLCCGNPFISKKSTAKGVDGEILYTKYCSHACYLDLNCGSAVYKRDKNLAKGSGGLGAVCSRACATKFFTGLNNANYKKGGFKNTSDNPNFIYLPRKNYVTKYIQDHRLAASKAIGRLLERGWFVIRTNKNKNDIRPENLFICESNSEYSKRRSGALGWPEKSNLENFKSRNGKGAV